MSKPLDPDMIPVTNEVRNLRANAPVEMVLGISKKRMDELTFAIEEICRTKQTKAEGLIAIAEIKATDLEKVYMGFLLCRYYIECGFPYPLNKMIMKRIG